MVTSEPTTAKAPTRKASATAAEMEVLPSSSTSPAAEKFLKHAKGVASPLLAASSRALALLVPANACAGARVSRCQRLQ